MAQRIEDITGPKPEATITQLFPYQDKVDEVPPRESPEQLQKLMERNTIRSVDDIPEEAQYTPTRPIFDENGFKKRSGGNETHLQQRWEKIDPDGTLLERIVATREKGASERSRERHRTKPKFPDMLGGVQKDQAQQVKVGEARYNSLQQEKEDRVTQVILEAQARRAAKKAGLQSGELPQARQGFLSTLKERSLRLTRPFRRS